MSRVPSRLVLAVALMTLSKWCIASSNTECVTGTSSTMDYCKTNLGGFTILTGAQFGALSVVFDGHWMLYDSNDSIKSCQLIFNTFVLLGQYRAKPWTNSAIQFPGIFEEKTGKKITKKSAPWAGCFFSTPDSYKILESFQKNTRYRYVIENRDTQNAYLSEMTPLAGKGITDAILKHIEISSERTSYKELSEAKQALGISKLDLLFNEARKLLQ